MNELEAALGIEQLKRVNLILERRGNNFRTLAAALAELNEVELLASSDGDFQSSYYCLSVLLKPRQAARRFEVVRQLNEHGVGTSVYYPQPVPYMSYYRDKYGLTDGDFPNASWISNASIALPVGPHLTDEDMLYMAAVLKEALVQG